MLMLLLMIPYISEIMHNPIGYDYGKEFIEIYHERWINLSGWTLTDGHRNETLISLYINKNSNFSMIIESDYSIPLPDISTYTTGTTIGSGGLSKGETIQLFDLNDTLIDQIYLNDTIVGHSLECINDICFQSQKLNGTPGFIGSKKNRIRHEIGIDFIGINKNITNAFKISIEKSNCSQKENITYTYEIWLNNKSTNYTMIKNIGCNSNSMTSNFILNIPGIYTLCFNMTECYNITAHDENLIPCNVSIKPEIKSIVTNHSIIYRHIANDSFEYIIEYWIEDIYNNIIKQKSNTSSLSWKSFTPKDDGAYIIKSHLVYISCNNTNHEDNQIIAIKTSKLENEIRILEVKNSSFGEVIYVKIKVTKGFEDKESIHIFAGDEENKISQVYYYKISTMNSISEITIPVQIKPNCDNSLKEGTYDIYVEGLGLKDKKEISIKGKKGNLCQIIEKKPAKISTVSSKTQNAPTTGKLDLKIDHKYNNKMIDINISSINTYPTAKEINIISYLYRGSKNYSRKTNYTKIIEPGKNMISIISYFEVEPGEYKYKIKIYEVPKKTPKEFIYNISIKNSSKIIRIENITTNKKVEKEHNKSKQKLNYENISKETIISKLPNNKITGDVVYLSSGKKSIGYIPGMLITISIISVVIILKRRT